MNDERPVTNDERPMSNVHPSSSVLRPPSSVVFVEQESQLGGVEMSTLVVAQGLDRSRYTPIVIAPQTGPLTTRCADADIPVYLSPRPHFRSASWRWRGHTFADPLALAVNPLRLWRASLPLAQRLADCAADLVVTKGLLAHFYGGWAARRLGLPCIWHVQDEVPERRAAGLYLRALRWAAQRLAAAVIGDAATIARQFSGHPNVYVVYNGIDTEEFSPQTRPGSLRADLGIPADALLVGNLARLTDWKGQHLLIEAAHRLAADEPRLHLVLIGSPLFDDDGYEKRMRRLAADGSAAARIHFAGYRTDAAACLAALNIYVHPSLRKDTAPLALLSALATGLPVVISAVPGMLEVVQPDCALIFPPGDSQGLTGHLRDLLRQPTLRGQLSVCARALAERRFSVPAHVEAMTRVFDQVRNGTCEYEPQSHEDTKEEG